MTKSRIVILALVALLAAVILFQLQRADRLRRELALLSEENARLRGNLTAQEQSSSSSSLRAGLNGDENEPQQKKMQELQSEVLRLRDAASRALRAEAEVAQLESALGSRKTSSGVGVSAGSEANSSSNAVLAYLGQAAPPPANIDPAYSKEGLLNAIQQAAQLADIPLKKIEIDTSEYPFLVGAVYDNNSDFDKVLAQLKNMPGYQYTGSTGGHGILAFNITPYGNLPSEQLNRVRTRMTVRTQMFFDQLAGR